MYYVTIYLIDRAYGGAHEGGWWYTYGEPIESELNKVCINKGFARRYFDKVEMIVKEWNKGRRDIYSVLSEGIYEVKLERFPPVPFPKERPHYE